ncbi:MAG: hypothetical protein LBE82_11875 [Chitinophagaceae bacterium]|jgi:hypothetical protein|nr:hypothetical protein [Chitinophagaceae bacterium]
MKIKIAAVFMLLSFGQKLGLPLLVHHYFHETNSVVKAQTASSVKVKCNCFDDALMPMQPEEYIRLKPVPQIFLLQNECYSHSFVSRELSVFSLRGPPCV